MVINLLSRASLDDLRALVQRILPASSALPPMADITETWQHF